MIQNLPFNQQSCTNSILIPISQKHPPLPFDTQVYRLFFRILAPLSISVAHGG